MKTILSIIIPYYDAEKTIERTLMSIQKMKRDSFFLFDVVIIDDGSSTVFPKNLLNNYDFVCKSYRTENNGPLLARCFGIEKTNNEYVYFLDSDDELCDTFFIDFCEQYREKRADIILVDFYKHGNITYENSERPQTIDDHYYIRHLAGIADLGYAVTQIFKRRFFTSSIKNELAQNKVRFSEDLLFWIKIFQQNRNYSSLKYPAYIYNVSSNSISTSFDYLKICDIVHVLNERFNFVLKYGKRYNSCCFFDDVVSQVCYLRKIISFHITKKEKAKCLQIFQNINFIDEMVKRKTFSLSLQNKLFFWIIKTERRHFLKHSV